VSDSKIAGWPRPESEDEIRSLLERARGGDPTDLAALRRAMDHYPEIWREYGDLAAFAQGAWIDLISGSDLVLRESLGRKVEAMTAELVGPAPSPLETLLVGRIAACWLQVSYADAAAARTGEMSMQQGNYLRKRQDSAHRRYLSAVGTLAMTRRLFGTSGSTARSSSDSTGPSRVVGSDPGPDEPGGHGTGIMAGEQAEDNLTLEFGPPRSDGPGRGQRGSPRRPMGTSGP
jgi:hypothetical protein